LPKLAVDYYDSPGGSTDQRFTELLQSLVVIITHCITSVFWCCWLSGL